MTLVLVLIVAATVGAAAQEPAPSQVRRDPHTRLDAVGSAALGISAAGFAGDLGVEALAWPAPAFGVGVRAGLLSMTTVLNAGELDLTHVEAIGAIRFGDRRSAVIFTLGAGAAHVTTVSREDPETSGREWTAWITLAAIARLYDDVLTIDIAYHASVALGLIPLHGPRLSFGVVF